MSKSRPQHSALPAFLSRQVREYRYFFLNASPDPKADLTVICGGWERCTADYMVQRTDFEYYGMEYVVQGRGYLTVAGVESELSPGSVFAYRPFMRHAIRSNPDDPLVKYFVDFSGKKARGIIDTKTLGAQGIATLHQTQPIDELYAQLLETGGKGGKRAAEICALLLRLLALRIEEHAHGPAEARWHSRARQSFDRSRALLQKEFRTLGSVTELARRTHFDPAYLSRLFDRFAGESPSNMLLRLKMSEAASHLMSGLHSVKEVSALVGYSDPYHFSRLFKHHYGVPPSRFHLARTRSK